MRLNLWPSSRLSTLAQVVRAVGVLLATGNYFVDSGFLQRLLLMSVAATCVAVYLYLERNGYLVNLAPSTPAVTSLPTQSATNTPQSTTLTAAPPTVLPSTPTPQKVPPIPRQVAKSLTGLVGLEPISSLLEQDLADFVENPVTRTRLFWGPPSSGKTEVAQRLSGLREGLPGLRLPQGEVAYLSGVDGKLEIKALVDQLQAGSIVFIDEADKCLDPSAGMVSQAESTQISHAILTHYSRKPILWIFLGTFSALRGEGRLTQEMLSKTLGQELASRVDFGDWCFPSWKIDTLLKAVSAVCERRGNQYEDDALRLVTEYCLKNNGGVRAFDTLDQALSRRLRRGGFGPSRITTDLVKEYLESLGVKAA